MHAELKSPGGNASQPRDGQRSDFFTMTLDHIARPFYRGGWLLVAALPYAQVLGRGVFNVSGAILLAWGLLSLTRRRPKIGINTVAIYLLMIVAFAAGLLVAQDFAGLTTRWRDFVLYSLLAFPVAAAIESDEDVGRLLDALALSGALTIATLYGIYLSKASSPDFRPEVHMREDNLPLLLPFMLYWLQYRSPLRHRWPSMIAALSLVTLYVVLSHGRAALVGLLTGLSVYALLVARWRWRPILLGMLVIFGLAVLIRGQGIYRDADLTRSLPDVLNSASSYRTELWQNALRHPPENLWIGSGMGNIPDVVLTVHGAGQANLKHLHNFLLDCWYETGILGLVSLLSWLSINMLNGFRLYSAGCPDLRPQAGTLLAASTAIIANALFSYSYTSKQFACYLLVFLLVFSVRFSQQREGRPAANTGHDLGSE